MEYINTREGENCPKRLSGRVRAAAKVTLTCGLMILLFFMIKAAYVRAQRAALGFWQEFSSYPQEERVRRRAMTSSLNALIPQSFQYLLDLSEGRVKADAGLLQPYVEYYQRVIDFRPGETDAYGLLGFCYYVLGDEEKALWAYTQAYQHKTAFFWYPHNIGLILLKSGRYPEAVSYFHKALAISPEESLRSFYSSHIYVQVRGVFSGGDQVLLHHLRAGYHEVFQMLILSHFNLKDFQAMYLAALAALKNFPEDAVFYYYAALALSQLREYQQSLAFLQESLKRDSKNQKAVYLFSLVLPHVMTDNPEKGVVNAPDVIVNEEDSLLNKPADFRGRIF